MKKHYLVFVILVFFFAVRSVNTALAQSFNKGSLLVSISEGMTYTRYSTTSTNDGGQQGNVNGDRDPITVEYGLTKHWGVGINLGGDILHVNPTPYYGFQAGGKDVKVITSEATLDAHYHFFVTRRIDLSAFASVGIAGVDISGDQGDSKYQYSALGGIVRVGTQARFYITKRFGFLAMASTYSTKCTTKDVSGNTVADNYSTTIKGYTWELGLCFRFLK